VVLDVDTGVDDACALLLAARHPGLDLRAVTCVAGNADVDQVVRNSLVVLDAAGRADVPVARGADRPLLEPGRPARHVHGADGMGDLELPSSSRSADPRHAVELLRDVLLEAAAIGRPVTLVPLAPMTNIALLLRTYPAAAAGRERIVFMGGAALVGNATAAAEFNVWHDPEAAAVVLDAAAGLSVPVTMYGLDVFYAPRVSRRQAAALTGSRSAATRLAGRLLAFQCSRFDEPDATIGDAGAVCAVLDPGGLSTRPLPVRVELAGTWTRGQTIVDQRDRGGDLAHDPHGLAPAVVDVALAVEADRYAALAGRGGRLTGRISAAAARTARSAARPPGSARWWLRGCRTAVAVGAADPVRPPSRAS
jgi:pyrimidine-specific ribonucleoside hydrolase